MEPSHYVADSVRAVIRAQRTDSIQALLQTQRNEKSSGGFAWFAFVCKGVD